MVHMDSGEVVVQHNRAAQTNKINTRGIKPIKLIHCKNYTVSNKVIFVILAIRIQLEREWVLLSSGLIREDQRYNIK